MRVEVRLFSHLRLALGRRTVALDLPPGATLATVLDQVTDLAGPDVETMIVDRTRGGYRQVGLINGQRSGVDAALRDGDVVSLLPPLGGG